MARRLTTDWTLFVTITLMVALGLVMIYSSSSITSQTLYHKEPYYFVAMQLFWAAVSFFVLMILKRFDYRRLRRPEIAFGAVGGVLFMLLLAYVLDPRHRWIPLGFAALQPSEFAKPALVVFLAYFLTWRLKAVNNLRYTLLPAGLLLALLLLLVAKSDLGTALVLGVVALTMFYVAGLDLKYVAAGLTLAMIAGLGFIWDRPDRLRRVVETVDPTFEMLDKYDFTGKIKPRIDSTPTVSDTNYQATQAKIAEGSGGIWGLGLMHGRQKHFYLPVSHTDFIYAVIGEELGLWGTTSVLLGFLVIMWRGIRLFLLAHDDFGRYLALGITVAICFQALFNMTVALGIGPTKGITLPMISYGGSSLLSSLISLGILLNISEHAG